MDSRKPPAPTGDGAQGNEPGGTLTMVRVPSDPAEVSINNPTFRVRLGPSSWRSLGRRVPVPAAAIAVPTQAEGATGDAPAPARRRAPVVWSGRSAPGDQAAVRLLEAVPRTPPEAGHAGAGPDVTATQVLPRLGRAPGGAVVVPRSPEPDATQLLPHVPDPDAGSSGEAAPPRSNGSPGHAYYPGRRMNLGVVLLPLRVFLGFMSIYAGMGKLSDPLFFDGGERGSIRTWLGKLEPWTIADPLYGLALAHPVGAGLTVAFLQIIVGVLTVCGLWQRLAAGVGALLALALLVTVSWHAAPAYEAPDILFLAAWSPLVIAGAPMYSLDARLAGEAWRRLGPRAELWELRRRVLRRGTVIATVLVGSSLLVGAMLGAAVRSSHTVRLPGPDEPPANHLPGSPLPSAPGGKGAGGPVGSADPTAPGGSAPASSEAPTAGRSTAGATAGSTSGSTAGPTAGATSGSTAGPGAVGTGPGQPAAPRETQAPPPPAQDPAPAPPTSGGGSSGASTGAGSGDGGSGTSDGGGGQEKKPGGLVGGLLG